MKKSRINMVEHIQNMTYLEAAEKLGVSVGPIVKIKKGVMPGKNAMRKIRRKLSYYDYMDLVNNLEVEID